MSKEPSWEDRAHVANETWKAKDEETTKRIDAALSDMTDWKAHCWQCGSNLVGTIADISAHMETCGEPEPD